MEFKYNYFGLVEPSHIYLCRTDNSIICELNGIDPTTVSYTKQINNFDLLQFDVHKYINGMLSNGYDMLDEAMYLRVDNIGYFRMSYPEVNNDGFDESKTVTAYSCDYELSLKSLVDFKINCGSLDSAEYLVDSNVSETGEGVKIAKQHIRLYWSPDMPGYNKDVSPKLSLLDLALEKVPNWSVGYVDHSVILQKIEKDGETITQASRRSFDIDSKSIYAFLTQDVSKKYECIFEFNTFERKINVYDINTYGKDSGVFISYRNLIQTLKYAPAQEDNIFTRFNVRGNDDLTIDLVNFGTSTIEDLSYFLNTNYHVRSDLRDKYYKWLEKVNSVRQQYMSFGKEYSILMEKRDEINYRVPNDGISTNWKQFTVEDLENTIKPKYIGYMEALKDPDLGYWDAENEKWLNRGAKQDYKSYEGILEIIDATIEYKKVHSVYDKQASDDLDNVVDSWKTNWDLYGVTELKNKQKAFAQNKETLSGYAKEWEELTETELAKLQGESHLTEAAYNISHKQYIKYAKWYDDCSKALEKRQTEYVEVQKQMKEKAKEMSALKSSIDKSNKEFGFSDNDLETLNKLYNDTDYTNDNILTISTDTAEQIIDTQHDLLEDALTELSKVCQPQLSFTLTMDNIFAMPQFREWQGNFDIGNFIYLSFDHNEQYFLKLRISSLTFNPCVIEGDFQIEFTNMISYNGGRNDFAVLMDESVSTAKNQISGKVKSTLDTSGIHVSDALIKALVNTNKFSNAISSGVYDTISANKGTFNELLARTINVQQLMAESGLFERVTVTGTTTSKMVLALDVNAERISVGTLSVDRLIIRGGENSLMYTFNETLGKVDVTKISEKEYNQYFMNGKNIAAHTITADEILANTITATEITTENLRGLSGWINLRKGTFAFYTRPDVVGESTDKINVYKKSLSDYHDKNKDKLTDLQKQFYSYMDFDIISINHDDLSKKIEELNQYTYKYKDAFPTDIQSILEDMIDTMQKYNLWLALDDKIYKDQKSISTLNGMTDFELETEFGIDADQIDILRKYINVKASISSELSWDGMTLTVQGEVHATSGNIGDLILKDGALYTKGHTLYNSNSNGVFINGSVIALGPNANICFNSDGTGNVGPWKINTDAIFKGNGYNSDDGSYFGNNGLSIKKNFVVDADGNLNAKNVNISGVINATSGYFSGELKGATGTFTGKLEAASGSFTGEIAADKLIANTAGTIAGWTITSDALSKNKGYNTTGGAYFGSSGLSISDKFIVSSDGVLNATGVTISGDITASSGKIGGYKIENGRLYNHMYGTAGSSLLGYSCGLSVNGGTDHALWAGNENFYVNMDGSMHCENADFVGSIVTSGEKVSTQLKNGQLSMDYNYGGIVLPKILMGLDSDNEPFMYFYNTAGYTGVSISSSGIISKPGFFGNLDGKVLNTKGEYKIPISSSTVSGYEIDTIRSVTNSGVKKIVVYGGFGSLSKLPSDNSAVAFSSSESDSRLKKNISDTKVSNALDQILQIKHREFDWKDDNYHNDIGYVAQELETINPRMVFKPENKNEMYSVNTFYMTSLITKSIQEMYTELKTENDKLKKRIEFLENQIN